MLTNKPFQIKTLKRAQTMQKHLSPERFKMLSTGNVSNISNTDDSFLSALILVSLSSCLFLAACCLLCSYVLCRVGRHIIESHLGIVILFLGALLAIITSLATAQDQEHVYSVYRLLLTLVVGTLLLVVGSATLFEKVFHAGPVVDDAVVRVPVGSTHGSVGIIVWVVTFPLFLAEVVFIVGGLTTSDKLLYTLVRFAFLVQKLVQAGVYNFILRHKSPKEDLRMACSWYLKVISLLNFACWVDSIAVAESDSLFLTSNFGNWFSVVKTAYNALVTDYRLLCCLLFLEHALEMKHVTTRHDENNVSPTEPWERSLPQSPDLTIETRHATGIGYVIGLVCIGLQVLNGMHYLGLVGAWSNLFPIVAEIIVILFGFMLLYGNSSSPETEGGWRETESKAIDVMVGFMGVVGFVFWFLKASFCSVWASRLSIGNTLYGDLVWTATKDSFYGIGVLFQLYFFYKTGPRFCCQPENRNHKYNHLFVPVIMLSLLALCVSCIVDEYSSEVEKLISGAQFSQALSTFLKAAAPIHLGFALHMFLHFYIMKRKMGQLEYHQRAESIFGQSTIQETEWEGHDVTRPLLARYV